MTTIPPAAIDAALQAGQSYTDTHPGAGWDARGLVTAILEAAEAAWPHNPLDLLDNEDVTR